MYKRVAFNSIAALALFGAATVHAESQPGFYAGAGIGQASLEADDVGFDANDTAFKVFGGYSFNDHFAVELTYLDGGAPDESFDFGIGTPVTVEADITAFGVSAVGRLPINDTFAIFGKLGYASYDVELTGRAGGFSTTEDASDEDLSYGIGLALSFGAFGLRAEYEAVDVSDGAFNVLSVSGLFKF
jgi:Outer membrane protein beta-barrel domain